MAYHDGSIRIDTKIDNSGVNKQLAGLKKGLIAAGAAIGASFTVAIKQGIDFESAFAGVRKTVDATESELAILKQGIRDMAKELPTSANEIAGVAEAAGQLGISKDKILDFTETMVKLGDSTNLTADEAATTLARFANITGMSQDNFNKLGSAIVALGNNFATTEAEISAMGMNIASAGTQVGMSEAQILGFATALSSVGMEAQAGGTAISKLMIDMQLATETGGEALNQFANVAGISAEQFKTAFKEDAAGAITSFISGLNDTERLGKSSIAVLDEMGITEVRLRDSILRAANAGDLFTDAIETGTKAWEDNTALTKEAEQRYETMESKLGMLKNGLIDLGISVYDGLEEPLKEGVSEAIDSLGDLQDSLSGGELKSALNGVGELFGELMTVVIKLAKTALPPLISAVGFLGRNIESVTPVVIGCVGAMKGFAVAKSVTKWFKVCMLAVNDYTAAVAANAAMETRGITISNLLLSTMKNQEIAVGALTGKIPLLVAGKELATRAQLALNAAWKANPAGMVIAGVAAVTVGVIALVKAVNKETEAEKEAREAREEYLEGIDAEIEKVEQLYDRKTQIADSYDDSVAGAEAEAKVTQELTDELFELHSKQDKTISDKKRMKKIVGDLNDSIEDLNLTYDEEKNALSLTKDKIYELIDAKKELALQNALQQGLEESYKLQFDLEISEESLIKDKIEAEKKIKDYIKQMADAGLSESDYYKDKDGDYHVYYAEDYEAFKNCEEIIKNLEAEREAVDKLNTALDENAEQQKDAADSVDYYSDKISKSYDETARASLKTSDEIRVAWEKCANDYGSTSDGMIEAANAFYSEMEKNAGSYGAEFMTAWKNAIDTGAFDAATSVSDMFDIVLGIMSRGKAEADAAAAETTSAATDAAAEVVGNESGGIGKDLILGMTGGMYESEAELIEAGEWAALSLLKAIKKKSEIRSPSRVMRDEVGAMLMKGLAIGIKENSWEVTDAVKQMFEDLELQKEVGAITEEDYYEKLRKYRDEYLEESTEEWWEYTKELMEYDELLRDKQFSDLEWLHESGQISEAKYYEELARLRDEYFEEGSDEWRDYTLEIQEYCKELKEAADEAIREGTDKFKDYYSAIIEVEMTDKDGNTERFYTLNDFSRAESLERQYTEALDNFKKRAGDNSVALAMFEELKGIDDIEEAIEKINFLLSVTDEQWNNMLAKKAGIEQKTYNDLSTFFGLDEQAEAKKAEAAASAVSTEFTSAAEDTRAKIETVADNSWEEIKKSFFETFGVLPDESYNIGVEMMQSLIKGAMSQLSSFHENVTSKIITSLNATVSSSGGSGSSNTESTGGGGDTYNFYSSKSTVLEQLKAASNQSILKRMRGSEA